jgi:ABC-type dipeptide/oligopeptide/nickel transport system permease component
MTRYTFQRLWQSLLSLFVLITIIFFLVRVTGNPVDLLLPFDATEADRQLLIKELGLDRAYHIQFFEFISRLIKGDMGNSILFKRPVIEIYFQRLPNTLKLVGVGVFFSILIALPLGVISGSRRGTWIDKASRVFTVIGIATPSFWLALVLINIFSVWLGVLPSARMGDITHYILPAFSMCLMSVAAMVRLLRSSLIEVLDSEYVKLARIKGVSQTVVLWKHCLRNSLITVVTYLGTNIGILIGGTVIIETVFAWPGAGRLAYEGIIGHDYPLVQSVILLHGTIIVFINLLVDILYSYIDPRIRVC